MVWNGESDDHDEHRAHPDPGRDGRGEALLRGPSRHGRAVVAGAGGARERCLLGSGGAELRGRTARCPQHPCRRDGDGRRVVRDRGRHGARHRDLPGGLPAVEGDRPEAPRRVLGGRTRSGRRHLTTAPARPVPLPAGRGTGHYPTIQ